MEETKYLFFNEFLFVSAHKDINLLNPITLDFRDLFYIFTKT